MTRACELSPLTAVNYQACVDESGETRKKVGSLLKIVGFQKEASLICCI